MSKYGTLFTKIWTDQKFREMEERDRLLFLYLLSSNHLNMLGLYYIPIPYMSYDLGWDCSETEKRLNNLINKKVVKYDFEANVVFIINYLKYNHLHNPNQVKGAGKALSELPETLLYKDLTASFYKYNDKYAEMFSQIISNMQTILKGFQNKDLDILEPNSEKNIYEKEDDSLDKININSDFIENVDIPPFLAEDSLFSSNQTVSKGFRNDDLTVSKSVTITETVTEAIDNNILPKKSKQRKKITKDKNLYKNEFDLFWNEYPRKEGKTAAYNNFIKVLNNNKDISPQDLIHSAKGYFALCTKNCSEMRFIKLPSTFLGKDEPFKDFIVEKQAIASTINSTNNINSSPDIFSQPNSPVTFSDMLTLNPSYAKAVNDLNKN